MASIDINAKIIGDKELSAALARLSSHDIPKAIKAGVRDAARAGRTTLAKSIGQRYSLTAGRIKKDVTQPQYRDGGQTAIIRTNRKPITAMQFKPKQTSKGLSMSIYRGQRTVVKSGFLAKGMPFRRVGKERMPLDVIHGPSIHAIYTGGKWAPALQARTEVRIEEALESGILRALGGMGRGFGRA
jgi:hypothetical protein